MLPFKIISRKPFNSYFESVVYTRNSTSRISDATTIVQLKSDSDARLALIRTINKRAHCATGFPLVWQNETFVFRRTGDRPWLDRSYSMKNLGGNYSSLNASRLIFNWRGGEYRRLIATTFVHRLRDTMTQSINDSCDSGIPVSGFARSRN